jgi:antibiotic biosynthesis monooxygenase (ABM) superfamily enzyme
MHLILERSMKMSVKVLIRRKVPSEKEADLLTLITQLRSLASRAPGYISGETLRNAEDREEYLVIGTWQHIKDWKAWLASQERKTLQGKIDKLLKRKTKYEVYDYPEKRPVTLGKYRRWEGG